MQTVEQPLAEIKIVRFSGFQHIGDILPMVLAIIARRVETREFCLFLMRLGYPPSVVHPIVCGLRRAA